MKVLSPLRCQLSFSAVCISLCLWLGGVGPLRPKLWNRYGRRGPPRFFPERHNSFRGCKNSLSAQWFITIMFDNLRDVSFTYLNLLTFSAEKQNLQSNYDNETHLLPCKYMRKSDNKTQVIPNELTSMDDSAKLRAASKGNASSKSPLRMPLHLVR